MAEIKTISNRIRNGVTSVKQAKTQFPYNGIVEVSGSIPLGSTNHIKGLAGSSEALGVGRCIHHQALDA